MTSTTRLADSSMALPAPHSFLDTPSQTTHRIKRKPPPKIMYGPRYPAPDLKDPLASMSELRDRRTHTSTNSNPQRDSDSISVKSSSTSLLTPRSSISRNKRRSGLVLSASPPAAGGVAIKSQTPWQGDMLRLSKEYNELSNKSFAERARKRASQDSYNVPSVLHSDSHSRRRSQSEFGPRSGTSSPVDFTAPPQLPPLCDYSPTPPLTPSESRRTSVQDQFFDAVQFPSTTNDNHAGSDSDLSSSSASYPSLSGPSRRLKRTDAHLSFFPPHHHESLSASGSSASTASDDDGMVSTSTSYTAASISQSVSVALTSSPEIITPLRSPSPSRMRILEVDMPLYSGRSPSPPPIPVPFTPSPRSSARLSRQSISSSISMPPLFKSRAQPQASQSTPNKRRLKSHTQPERLPLPQSTAKSSSQSRTSSRIGTSSLSTPSSPSPHQSVFHSKPPTSFPFRISMRNGHSETSLPRSYDGQFISPSTMPRATETLHSTSLPMAHMTSTTTLPSRVLSPTPSTSTSKPRSRSIEAFRRGIPAFWKGKKGSGSEDRDGSVSVRRDTRSVSEHEPEMPPLRGRDGSVLKKRSRKSSAASAAPGPVGDGIVRPEIREPVPVKAATTSRSAGISMPQPDEDLYVSTSLASPPMSPALQMHTSFIGQPPSTRASGSSLALGMEEMAGDDVPSKGVLERVSRMEVTAENGARVQFGEVLGWDLETHSGKPPVLNRTSTVVVFLRHFWCPNCQDYVSSIMHDVDHDALSRSGVKLVLVGCGSYGLIKSYRHIFDLPYPIYTDSSQQLYRALGLHMTEERSIPSHIATHMHPTHQGGGARYVKHKSVGAFAMVVRRALKVGMPVWEKGGDAAQLGGEFVFGPDRDRTCVYAHRMLTKSGHADVRMVLAKAGFGTPLPSPTSRGSGLWFVSAEEEAAWMESRRRSLVRMKEKKEMRRASVDSRLGFNAPTMITTPLVLDGDEEATVQPSPADRGRNRDKRTTATLSIVREDGRGDGGLEMEWGGSSESMGSVVIISHAQGSSSDASTSATSSASASA